jgi:hypothetical protein
VTCSPASAPLALQLSDYFFSKPAAPAAGSADGGTKRGGAGGAPAAKRLRHQYVDANVEDEEEKAVKE